MLESEADERRGVVDAELGHQVPAVGLHRLRADEELGPDLGVRVAGGDQAQDLLLAQREHPELVAHRRLFPQRRRAGGQAGEGGANVVAGEL